MKITSAADLEAARQAGLQKIQPGKPRIAVGLATCGIAVGGNRVYERLREIIERDGLDIVLTKTGCIGYCKEEPLVNITIPKKPLVILHKVTEADAEEIVRQVSKGKVPADKALCRVPSWDHVTGCTLEYGKGFTKIPLYEKVPFFKGQKKVILRDAGLINPEDIDEYIAVGGYAAAMKALTGMDSEAIIKEVEKSGLRGRGGAGFPTGLKWRITRDAKADKKYIICNADEGDPGAYMNRNEMESDPHMLIEGMIIGAYAMGAAEGLIYIRAEYPLAIKRLKLAIGQAREYGLLGNNIFGTGFSFDIGIATGAGAFVCGESTALVASIEGRTGRPHPRPPRLTDIGGGLFGIPHGPQQCRDLVQCAGHHHERQRLVRHDRGKGQHRHQGVLPCGESRPGRPRGSAARDNAQHDRVRYRQRRRQRQERESRPDRRAIGRLHPAPAVRYPGGLREPQQGRLDHGLRGHRGHGRGHGHGRHRPLLHQLRYRRVLREMRPLPGGAQALAPPPQPDHGKEGHEKGSRNPCPPVRHHCGNIAVRAWPDSTQPGADNPCVFQGRIRCAGETMTHEEVSGAGAPKKQVTVTINGKKYPADEGEILLGVAIREKIAIPHLCYEPSLDPYGACRLCMVEVIKHGKREMTTSCTLRAAEGLEVVTDTPEIVKYRNILFELYLAEAPKSEVIKAMAARYGVTKTRFLKKTRYHGFAGQQVCPLRAVRAGVHRDHGCRCDRLYQPGPVHGGQYAVFRTNKGLLRVRCLREGLPDPCRRDGRCRGYTGHEVLERDKSPAGRSATAAENTMRRKDSR